MSKSTVSRYQILVLIGLGLTALSSKASAQTINWGNTVGHVNFDSNGDALTDATFTFEFGVFTNNDGPPATEFSPNAGNTDLWGDSWTALDSASYNDGASFFSSSWDVLDNTYSGFQAYIWVYNNQAGDETSEWVLITDFDGADAWTIPAQTGSQTSLPVSWRVSNAADVVFGGLNNVDGPGETDPGAPTTFALQTGTFLPVPETGTSLLFGLTFVSLLLRRSRKF